MEALRIKYHEEMSVEEYLAFQDATEEKWEYMDGKIYCMAGAMPDHNRITKRVTTLLDNALGDGPCEVFNSEQRLHLSALNVFYFPDVSVYCEEPAISPARKDSFTNPTLIVEVLSQATENFDRGTKFVHYRFIPSLQEYMLISSGKMQIEVFRKINAWHWEMQEYCQPDEEVILQSLNLSLRLADIYHRVKFEDL